MAMPHRLNLRRPSLLPEVGTIAAALAAALFLVLYGPPAQGAGRSGKQGDILTVEFAVIGIPCIGLDGGPHFRHSEAFSFQVAMDDQAETDRLWNAIVSNGGQESQCGRCRDRWGLSWQITPRALIETISDPDAAAARRAFEAMMTMGKIDIAATEAARRG
jgi:2-polyprenyl-6-hydroxyphenyl methylase/3-demethylubiquinone-9 3-methyltransferase